MNPNSSANGTRAVQKPVPLRSPMPDTSPRRELIAEITAPLTPPNAVHACISEYARNELKRRTSIPSVVIPPELPNFTSNPNTTPLVERHRLHGRRLILHPVGSYGRKHLRKGLEFAKHLSAHQPTSYWVTGATPDWVEAQEPLPPEPKIITGRTDDIAAAYTLADVVILSSSWGAGWETPGFSCGEAEPRPTLASAFLLPTYSFGS